MEAVTFEGSIEIGQPSSNRTNLTMIEIILTINPNRFCGSDVLFVCLFLRQGNPEPEPKWLVDMTQCLLMSEGFAMQRHTNMGGSSFLRVPKLLVAFKRTPNGKPPFCEVHEKANTNLSNSGFGSNTGINHRWLQFSPYPQANPEGGVCVCVCVKIGDPSKHYTQSCGPQTKSIHGTPHVGGFSCNLTSTL